jgi:hypothetical protein
MRIVPRPRQVGHTEGMGFAAGCVDADTPHVVVLGALSTSPDALGLRQKAPPKALDDPRPIAQRDLVLAALDGVRGRDQEAPPEVRPSHSAGAPSPGGRLKPQAMADPVYDRIDVVTLTLAVVLAAGIVFLLAELVPQLLDLMMMPPPLSGAR